MSTHVDSAPESTIGRVTVLDLEVAGLARGSHRKKAPSVASGKGEFRRDREGALPETTRVAIIVSIFE